MFQENQASVIKVLKQVAERMSKSLVEEKYLVSYPHVWGRVPSVWKRRVGQTEDRQDVGARQSKADLAVGQDSTLIEWEEVKYMVSTINGDLVLLQVKSRLQLGQETWCKDQALSQSDYEVSRFVRKVQFQRP